MFPQLSSLLTPIHSYPISPPADADIEQFMVMRMWVSGQAFGDIHMDPTWS